MTAFTDDFALRWLTAWNSHDTDEVLALLDDDVVWDDPVFWHEVLHGTAAVRGYVEKIWSVMPDVAFTEVERFANADGTRGLVLFEQSGSGSAQLGADRRFRSHGCDIFLSFRDGRLAHYLASYDIVGMLEQLGAVPPRGTRTGSAHLVSLARRAGAG